MLKLGTVFSGIGAIEHALERLRIPAKIVFACDNGGVDILSKEVEEDFNAIQSELDELQSVCSREYRNNLENAVKELHKIYSELLTVEINQEVIIKAYQGYKASGYMNANQVKAYASLLAKLKCASNENEAQLLLMRLAVKLDSDLNKSDLSPLMKQELVHEFILNLGHYKQIIKQVKMLSESLSMLHERINTDRLRSQVFAMQNAKEQKQFVDSLYAKHESSNKVKQSYLANYKIDSQHFHWNVSLIDGRHHKDDIDLFVGGSPCQSFSLVGKQRGLEDTRGTLFYEFARLIKEIQPKVFIYENVRAILSNDNGETWKTITEIFNQLGYDWHFQILNAKDYGIPQNRERLFVVGFRKDLNITGFKFPQPIPLEPRLKDFLLDNVSGKYYLPNKVSDLIAVSKNLEKGYTKIDGEVSLCQNKNQQFNWHGDFIFEEQVDNAKLLEDLEKYFLSEKIKKYVLATGTKGFYSRPEIDLDIARPLLQSMHKMHRAGVDNYVTTAGRLRKLTPRECLRLMGFCDSFKIVVSDTSAYQQAGNSIVVNVLMHLLKEILAVYPELK